MPEAEVNRRVIESTRGFPSIPEAVRSLKAVPAALPPWDPEAAAKPGLIEAASTAVKQYGEVNEPFNRAALGSIEPGTPSVPMWPETIDKALKAVGVHARVTPKHAARQAFIATMTPFGDPLPVVGGVIGKGVGKLGGIAGKALEGPLTRAFPTKMYGAMGASPLVREAARVSGVGPDVAEGAIRGISETQPLTNIRNQQLIRNLEFLRGSIKPAEMNQIAIAAESAVPERAAFAMQGLSPEGQAAALKLREMASAWGASQKDLMNASQRPGWLPHVWTEEVKPAIVPGQYMRRRELPERLTREAMGPEFGRRAQLEQRLASIDPIQARYLGRQKDVFAKSFQQEPPVSGWGGLADESRAGQMWRSTMEKSPQSVTERALARMPEGPYPEPIETAAEVNRYLAQNRPAVGGTSKAAGEVEKKAAGWGFDKPLFEENIPVALAREGPQINRDISYAEQIRRMAPMASKLPEGMVPGRGWRNLGDLHDTIATRSMRTALGAKPSEVMAVPESLFMVLKKEAERLPPDQLDNAMATLRNAWTSSVTTLGGPAYYSRNVQTSLYTILDRYGLLQSPLAMKRGAEIRFGVGQGSIAGVPIADIREALRRSGRFEGSGVSPSKYRKLAMETATGKTPTFFSKPEGLRGFFDIETSPLARKGGAFAGAADEWGAAAVVAGELERGVPLQQAVDAANKLIPQTRNLAPWLEKTRQVAPFFPWGARAAKAFGQEAAKGKLGLPIKIQQLGEATAAPGSTIPKSDMGERQQQFSVTPTGRVSGDTGMPVYLSQGGSPLAALNLFTPITETLSKGPTAGVQQAWKVAQQSLVPWIGAPTQMASGQEAWREKSLSDWTRADPYGELLGRSVKAGGEAMGADKTTIDGVLKSMGVYPLGIDPSTGKESWVQSGALKLATKSMPWGSIVRAAQAQTPEETFMAALRLVGIPLSAAVPQFREAESLKRRQAETERIRRQAYQTQRPR
mgnify:FL=1